MLRRSHVLAGKRRPLDGVARPGGMGSRRRRRGPQGRSLQRRPRLGLLRWRRGALRSRPLRSSRLLRPLRRRDLRHRRCRDGLCLRRLGSAQGDLVVQVQLPCPASQVGRRRPAECFAHHGHGSQGAVKASHRVAEGPPLGRAHGQLHVPDPGGLLMFR